jgi:hypothetical protein
MSEKLRFGGKSEAFSPSSFKFSVFPEINSVQTGSDAIAIGHGFQNRQQMKRARRGTPAGFIFAFCILGGVQ